MRVDRKFLYWGAFFVTLGAVLLAADGNLVDDAALRDAWRLWPVLVIALGLGIILYRTRLNPVGGMLIAVTPALVLGTAISVVPQSISCGVGTPASMASQQGTFGGPATVDVRLTCGRLNVTTAPGSDWQLQSGSTEKAAAQVDAGADHLSIQTGREQSLFGLRNGRDVFQLTLPTANPIDLSAEVDAGVGRLNLSNAQLRSVALTTNGGETRLNLTGASVQGLTVELNAGANWLQLPSGTFAGSARVNMGSLNICIPPDLGLAITSKVQLGSARYPGFQLTDGVWYSPGYASAANKGTLTVDVNLGSVEMNPIGGCL